MQDRALLRNSSAQLEAKDFMPNLFQTETPVAQALEKVFLRVLIEAARGPRGFTAGKVFIGRTAKVFLVAQVGLLVQMDAENLESQVQN